MSPGDRSLRPGSNWLAFATDEMALDCQVIHVTGRLFKIRGQVIVLLEKVQTDWLLLQVKRR